MAKQNYVEHVTVLWGLPKNSGSGVVRAAFGKHSEREMVQILQKKNFGSGNPPFTPCVVRTFEFTGKDAVKIHFLAKLSKPTFPILEFTGVFASLASGVSYGTLIKPRKRSKRMWQAKARRIEDNNHIQRETEFLATGQNVPTFNFWPMLHRFERRVHTTILQEPEIFRQALWSEAIRNRPPSK